MTVFRKFTIGVAPYTKMYRVHGAGGQVADAVLALRLKALSEDFFEEVLVQSDRAGYRLTGRNGGNVLSFNDQNISFTRDYYEFKDVFDFNKVLDQFRIIWGAVNSVLQIADVRRIGMVSESKYEVPGKVPSPWMRNKFTPLFESDLHAAKFQMRFEDRELASDGLAPDPKKADFINTIYQVYDSELDIDHSMPGYMFTNVDVQRYFAPVIQGKAVPDETLKLRKHFETVSKKFDERMKTLGASHAKK